MSQTHAYLSAQVWMDDVGYSGEPARLVVVKAHTFSASLRGWCQDARIRWVLPKPLSTLGIVRAKHVLREKACARADEVTGEVFHGFADLAYLITYTHGELYPTWVGDLYVTPVFTVRGTARERSLDHYLITEAPGLDCGHWEEDPLPLRGG